MPTLNVNLTPEFADFIEGAVASGSYVSASEVVRDVLRVMRQEQESEAGKLALLRAAIDRGMVQSEQGEQNIVVLRVPHERMEPPKRLVHAHSAEKDQQL